MSRSAVNKAGSEAVTSDAATPAPWRHRLRRALLVALALVVVVGAIAAIADTVAASRGEHRLSTSLASAAGIAYPPEVTLGGLPFLTHASSGEFTGATITARGVPIAQGCSYPAAGPCFAELGATLGTLRVPNGFNIGSTDTMHAASVIAYSRLDSVNLGRMLGVLDLTVNTPAGPDRVGGGGPQFGNLERTSGIVLTGSVALPPDSAPPTGATPSPQRAPSASEYPGPRTRVSVTVEVSVRDGRLHVQATGFYTGPEKHVEAPELVGADKSSLRAAVLARFTATLPLLPMPWDLPATGAHSSGSDILLTAGSGPRDLLPGLF
ncbi:LmeA family phospholipid-binding protein [Gordonia oryzae]|uniref:LmeA family phospholipid-binding protein n=1 Tax=Gordonia oryzae TaxID=2487349 RepID=UPI001607BE1F